MVTNEWACMELSRYLYPLVRDREQVLTTTIKIIVKTRVTDVWHTTMIVQTFRYGRDRRGNDLVRSADTHLNPLGPRSFKSSIYIIENVLDFLTTKSFRRQISMKLFYEYMVIFFNLSPTFNHLYPLQVENCDSNSRLVVDEDDKSKFSFQRVNIESGTTYTC